MCHLHWSFYCLACLMIVNLLNENKLLPVLFACLNSNKLLFLTLEDDVLSTRGISTAKIDLCMKPILHQMISAKGHSTCSHIQTQNCLFPLCACPFCQKINPSHPLPTQCLPKYNLDIQHLVILKSLTEMIVLQSLVSMSRSILWMCGNYFWWIRHSLVKSISGERNWRNQRALCTLSNCILPKSAQPRNLTFNGNTIFHLFPEEWLAHKEWPQCHCI